MGFLQFLWKWILRKVLMSVLPFMILEYRLALLDRAVEHRETLKLQCPSVGELLSRGIFGMIGLWILSVMCMRTLSCLIWDILDIGIRERGRFRFEAFWLLEETCEAKVRRLWETSIGTVLDHLHSMGERDIARVACQYFTDSFMTQGPGDMSQLLSSISVHVTDDINAYLRDASMPCKINIDRVSGIDRVVDLIDMDRGEWQNLGPIVCVAAVVVVPRPFFMSVEIALESCTFGTIGLPELELLFGILLGCFWDRLVPIELKGDSSVLISKFNIVAIDRSIISSITWNAKRLVLGFEHFMFHHIKLEGNTVANLLLAKVSSDGRISVGWRKEEGPALIQVAVDSDQRGGSGYAAMTMDLTVLA
ncbi:hypothetical protein GOBAR_AA01106 [Gossypium barbadense]|uniref:RNase H type-1 domain-containing protein n=1 Tax=Gossypium barbadense TaxID=3634 RepID=A0A2P5YV41_GOSBA|nr:hypothetical protein GOBAR_AA01106 [Gossypium barbadense]